MRSDNNSLEQTYDSEGDPRLLEPQSFVDTTEQQKSFSVFRFNKLAFMVTGLAMGFILLIGLVSFILTTFHSNKTADTKQSTSYAVGTVSLKGVKDNTAQLEVGQANHLAVNGQLEVSNALVLAPTTVPKAPTVGQIYYDRATNQPYYYNGSKFLQLGSATQTVTALGEASGLIGLGAGLQISGNQLSLTSSILQAAAASNSGGVLSLTGTADQVLLSGSTGNLTVSLPQSIALTSSPTFGGATLNGSLTVTSGDVSLSASGLINANNVKNVGANDITIDASGNNIVFKTSNGTNTFLFPTSGGTGQVICTTGVTCASGGGQAVVLEPTGVQTASANRAAIFVNKASGSGNLIQLQSAGTDALVIDNGGHTTVTDLLVSLGTLTVGTPGGATGNLRLSNTSSSRVVNLQGLNPTGAGNATVQIPSIAGGSTATICLDTGNCAGSGGAITGVGSAGSIAKFTAGNTIANSTLSESATTVTASGNLVIQGTNSLTLGTATSNTGTIAFKNGTNGNTVTLQSGVSTGNLTFTLPTADGSNGQCLSTDGTGKLQFVGCLTGGTGVSSLNSLVGALNLAGTANQVTVTPSGGNTLTFSLPQNIHTGAAPTFAGLTLNGASQLVLGSVSQLGQSSYRDGSSSFASTIQPTTLTANRTLTIPNASGTLAVSASGNIALDAAGNITFTGTLPVVSGGTGANNAATARSNLGAAASGANADITSLTVVTSISPAAALTIGSTSQTLTLQGNASSTIKATNAGNTATVGFTSPTATRTITFPDESGTVCLQTSANCGFSAGGSGVTSLNSLTGALSIAGTANRISVSAVGSTVTLNLPQDIATTSSPTFAGLNLTSALTVANGGTGASTLTANGILYGNGTGAVQATAAAANSILATNGSNVPSLTQTLPTAVQGNITSTGALASGSIASGFGAISTGNNISTTASLQGGIVNATTGFRVGGAAPLGHYLRGDGGNYIDSALLAGDISGTLFTLAGSSGSSQNVASGGTVSILKGSSNNLTTVASATNTLTVDIVSNPTFAGDVAVQGAGGLTVGIAGPGGVIGNLNLANTTSSRLVTLQGLNPTGTGNATIQFPSIAGGSSDVVCLQSKANCVGTGGGVSTTGGTSGTLAMFSGASSIVDSILSQSGSVATVAGTLVVSNASSLTLGTASTNTGSVAFKNSTNANTLTLQSGVTSGNLTFTLPTSDGSNGQCLATDGSGALAFTTCLSGGGGGGVVSLNGMSGVLLLNGTANQVVVNSASGTITLSLPQNIATTSSPTFGGLTLNGTLSVSSGNVELSSSGIVKTNNINPVGANNISIDAGANNVVFSNGSGANTFLLPTSGGLGQTICTSGITCASGGGQAVILEPGGVQSASANQTAVFINKAGGSGNLIQLQTGGADAFVINNSGTTSITTLSTNTITPTGSLTIGASGQSYTLQGNASSTIKATNAGNTATVGFTSPTATRTITFPDESGTVCLQTSANCGFSAGGSGVTSLNSLTGALSIAGTANRISVSAVGSTVTLNLPQDIATTSSPTFAGLNLTSALTVANGGTGASTLTANGILYGNGTGAVQATAAAANSILATNGSNVPSLTQTLPTAVQGNITSTGALASGSIASGFGAISTGNNISTTASLQGATINATGSIQLGGANINTAGTLSNVAYLNQANTFTNDIAIQGTNGLTLGVPGSVTGNLTFANSGSSRVLTLQGLNPSGTGNATIQLPSIAGGSSDTVCLLTLANCVGTGGGITGTGTAGTLPKFGTSSTLTDSILSESASTVTANGNLVIQGTNSLTLGTGSNLGQAKFRDGSTAFGVTLQSATLTNNRTITIPDAGGTLAVSASGNIALSAAGNITFTGTLAVANGGTGATTLAANGILYGNGTGAIQATATANNSVLVTDGSGNPSLAQTLPTAVQGNITSTGALAAGSIASGFGTISTGNNITTSATLQGGVVNASGVGAAIQLNGANINTAGTLTNVAYLNQANSFSAANTFTAAGTALQVNNNAAVNGTLTTGTLSVTNNATVGGTLTVNGASVMVGGSSQQGLLALNAGNTKVGSLQTISTLGQNTTYTLPDPGAGTATICLSSGNCAGSGGGITGSGTTGKIAKFSGSGSITDSTLSESATTITASGNVVIQGTGSLTLGTASTNTGSIAFKNATNANTFTLQSGVTGGNLTFTLPTADGSNGQCLSTNGGGTLSFATCLTGGSGNGVATLNGLSGALDIVGTTDQITVSPSGTNITLSLPQDIATTSSPTFAGLTLSSALTVANGGTGAGSFTVKGLLYGNGTGALVPAAAGTSGQLLLADVAGTPTFTTLGGDATISNTGSLTVAKLQGSTLTVTTPATGQVLQYNGSAFVNGLITNANLQAGTFGNITGTGALAAGSIASGFGAISTTNGITTTGTVQGGTVNATSAIQLGGANINTAGTLSNVAYLNQANNFSAANTFSAAGTALQVTNDASVGGTLTAGTLSVTNNGSFGGTLTVSGASATIGAAAQAGTLKLHAGNTKIATLQAISTLAQNTTYTLPDPGAATTTICVSTGNCAGAGTGITGAGTAGKLAKFSTSNNIVDSTLSESGTTVTASGNVTVQGNTLLQTSSNSTTAFQIQNQAGTSNLFIADTSNTRIGIGAAPANSLLTIGTNSTTTAGGIIFGTDTSAELYRSAAGTLTASGSITIQGTISSPGAGASSEHFGAGSTAAGAESTVIGNAATSAGCQSVVVGRNAASAQCSNVVLGYGAYGTSIGGGAVAVGANANACGLSGIAIGSSATNAVGVSAGTTCFNQSSIAIGVSAANTAGHQLVIGGSSSYINNAYIGSGVTDTAPVSFTLQGTGGSGSNIAGASVTLAGGQGTGTGVGGNLNFQVAAAGSTGSSLNSLATVFSLTGGSGAGAALFQNAVDSTTAFRIQSVTTADTLFTADTSANKLVVGNATGTNANTTLLVVDSATADPTVGYNGAQYYNTTNNKFRCYEGGTWKDCVTAAGVTTVGTIDTQTKSANGAVISGTSIYLQTADATNVGLVSTGTQTLAGAKTLTGAALFRNAADSTTAFRIQSNTTADPLFTADTSANKLVVGNSTGTNTDTTLLVLDNASADPATGYKGAMYYNTNTDHFRCYQGSAWIDCTGSGSGVTTVGTIDSQTKSADGAVISSNTIYLQSADGSNPGLVTTGTQTFAGAKTFTGAALFQNAADSSTAFRIQNVAGNNYLLADTLGASVSLGNTGIASTVQIGNTTGAVAQTINLGNNATASSTTTLTVGSVIGTSATTIESGSGTLAIGNGATAHTIQVGTGAAVQAVTVGSTNSTSTLTLQGGNSASAVSIQSAASGTISIASSGVANNVQIGNTTGAVSQTINLGNNTTGGSTSVLNIGSAIGTSATTIESGSGTLAIGNGATAHTIQLGTGAAAQAVTVGSTNSTSTLTLQGGNGASAVSVQSATSGTIGIGSSGVANTVQIGNTTGAVAQTINLGNNATASSTTTLNVGSAIGTSATTVESGSGTLAIGNGATAHTIQVGTGAAVQAVTVGSTNSTSTLTLQGGNSASAVSLQSAASGTISVGTSGVANTVQIGNTTGAVAQTINIGNNATASSTTTLTVGSAIGTSSTTIESGSGTLAIGNGNTAHTIQVGTGSAIQGVTVGSTNSTSTLTLQGGNSASAVSIQSAASGTVALASSGVANTLQLGNSSGNVTQTINIGNNTTGTTNVNIGNSAAGTVAVTGPTTITNRTSGSADTLVVNNSASTGTIAKFQDNATTVFSIADGGAALFQNTTNSSTAFQIQNAAGSSILTADSSPINSLLTNSNFESTTISSWVYLGTPGSVAWDTTQQYLGSASLKVVTTANASNGVKYVTGNGAGALATSTTYTISWYDKLDAASAALTDIRAVYARDGSTETACTSQNTQTVVSGSWTRHFCQIVTDGTTPASTAYVAIEQTAGAVHTFYVDGVQIETGSTATAYKESGLSLNGVITSPAAFKNQSNSTTAFQIQNASGLSLLTVDTANTKIVLGAGDGTGTPAGLTVRGAAAAGSNISAAGSNLIVDAVNGTGTGSSGDLVFRTAAAAPVTFDQTLGVTDPGGTPTGSFTMGAAVSPGHTNNILIVAITTGGNNTQVVSTVTYAGVSMTKFNLSLTNNHVQCPGTNPNTCELSVWYLVNPTADGAAHDVIATLSSGTANWQMGATSYYNVDQTTPLMTPTTATGTTTGTQTFTNNITTTASGQVPLDFVASNQALTMPGASQTVRYNKAFSETVGSSNGTSSSPGTTGMQWRGNTAVWGWIGTALNPVSATGASSLADRLHVTASGNVGINVAAPTQTLQVAGTALVQSLSNNSTTAFQIQNTAGVNLLAVDTTSSNMITNSTFDIDASGWALTGTTGTGHAISRTTTAANVYQGAGALQLVTANGTANTGAVVNTFNSYVDTTLGGTYTLSFMARATVSFSTFSVTVTGGGAPTCLTNQTIGTSFQRFTCTFATDSSLLTALNFITTNSTQRTIYIDAVQLVQSSSSTPFALGGIQFNGIINSPTTFQNASNSTTAFQIQNQAGTSNLFVADTANTRIGIGTNAPLATFHISSGGTDPLFRITDTSNTARDVLNVADGGALTLRNQTDSSTAFLIQNALGTASVFTVDTSGLVVTVAGTTTTFGSLTVTNAHIKSTQTTAPTIGTPTNCATTPTATVTAGSTDSAGSFIITTGTAGGQTTCDTVITFNKAYGAAPKSIVLQSTTAVGSATGLKPVQVSASSTTTFTVKLTTPPGGAGEVNGFYYWIVE